MQAAIGKPAGGVQARWQQADGGDVFEAAVSSRPFAEEGAVGRCQDPHAATIGRVKHPGHEARLVDAEAGRPRHIVNEWSDMGGADGGRLEERSGHGEQEDPNRQHGHDGADAAYRDQAPCQPVSGTHPRVGLPPSCPSGECRPAVHAGFSAGLPHPLDRQST